MIQTSELSRASSFLLVAAQSCVVWRMILGICFYRVPYFHLKKGHWWSKFNRSKILSITYLESKFVRIFQDYSKIFPGKRSLGSVGIQSASRRKILEPIRFSDRRHNFFRRISPGILEKFEIKLPFYRIIMDFFSDFTTISCFIDDAIRALSRTRLKNLESIRVTYFPGYVITTVTLL